MQLGKTHVAAFFSEDLSVQRYFINTFNWASICFLLDGLVTVMIGIIKGIGKQA